MSKLSKLGRFFQAVGKFAPLILAVTPLAPIAPAVMAAIQEAEALHGAGTGVEKLAHVKAIALDAAAAANAQAGKIVVDPAEIGAAVDQSVAAVVAVANVVKPD